MFLTVGIIIRKYCPVLLGCELFYVHELASLTFMSSSFYSWVHLSQGIKVIMGRLSFLLKETSSNTCEYMLAVSKRSTRIVREICSELTAKTL